MNNKILTFFPTLLMALLASFSVPQPANSAPETVISAEKKALIADYLEAQGGREAIMKNLDATFVNLKDVLPMLLTTLIQGDKSFSASQKAEILKTFPELLGRLTTKYQVAINQEIDLAKLIEDTSFSTLDKYFTETELQDLIAFYKSSTGKKIVSLQPQIYAESSAKINAALIPVLQKVIARLVDEEFATIKKTKPKN